MNLMSDNIQFDYAIFGENEIVQIEGWAVEGTNNPQVDTDILEGGGAIAATVDFAVQNYSTLLSKLAD